MKLKPITAVTFVVLAFVLVVAIHAAGVYTGVSNTPGSLATILE